MLIGHAQLGAYHSAFLPECRLSVGWRQCRTA